MSSNRKGCFAVKQIVKAFKCRLYPTKQQEQQLQKTFGCTRFVYNHLLHLALERKKLSKVAKHYFPSKVDFVNCVALLKEDFAFLKEVDSIALQASAEGLHEAFLRYFNKQNRFPTFKKRASFKSYTTKAVNHNIRLITKHRITLPKLGSVRLKNSFGDALTTGQIQRATISQEADGTYYVSILVKNVLVHDLPKTNVNQGIDLGLAHFAALSDETFLEAPRALFHYEHQLKQAQRTLSRRIERAKKENRALHDSKNVQKARQQVARLHAKIKHVRQDFLQKASTALVRAYDVIVLEALNVRDMLQSTYAKGISDASWAQFKTMLHYKALWYGKTVKLVNPAYTSQTCNKCGHIDQLNRFGQQFRCTKCQHEDHADTNAAKNILQAAR